MHVGSDESKRTGRSLEAFLASSSTFPRLIDQRSAPSKPTAVKAHFIGRICGFACLFMLRWRSPSSGGIFVVYSGLDSQLGPISSMYNRISHRSPAILPARIIDAPFGSLPDC